MYGHWRDPERPAALLLLSQQFTPHLTRLTPKQNELLQRMGPGLSPCHLLVSSSKETLASVTGPSAAPVVEKGGGWGPFRLVWPLFSWFSGFIQTCGSQLGVWTPRGERNVLSKSWRRVLGGLGLHRARGRYHRPAPGPFSHFRVSRSHFSAWGRGGFVQ